MDKNKISIVIPVYNAEEYLSRCLDSILDQDCSSYEVILVDDGSTDASPLICDRYSATDPRFRTIHKPNGGVSSARNAGINLAKGEYVMFVDSDDALMPGALKAMTEGCEGEDLVVGGFVEYIDSIPARKVRPDQSCAYPDIRRFIDENLRRNCEMLDAPWAKLFKRKSIAGLRFDESLNYAEDKLFVFGFMTRCRGVRAVSAEVYSYYLRPGSLGSDRNSDRHLDQLAAFLPQYAEVLRTLSAQFPDSKKIHDLYRRDLIGRYVCRILNILSSRKTSMLSDELIRWVYGLMSADKELGIFSLRPGQIGNLILYKLGKPGFTRKVYGFTSSFVSLFRR